jgi:hypothetical protein
MIPLTALFIFAGKILVPKFVKWYYSKTITEKAREYFERNCVATGMNFRGAKISILIGAIFYFLIRVAAAFPEYLLVSVVALIVVFFAIDYVGMAVAGRVRENRDARWRYCKRFYAPTVTGLGLALGTLAMDFMIHGATIGLSYLQAILKGVATT